MVHRVDNGPTFFSRQADNPIDNIAADHGIKAKRRGTGIDVSAGYDLLAEHDDLVRADVGMAYANRSLMQTFFGIDKAQSVNTGYNVYTPDAGIAGAAVSVSWRHAFNRNWTSTAGVGVVKLRGPAADSPLTERATSPVASAMVGYRF